MPSDALISVQEQFTPIAEFAQRFCFITRDSSFQKEAVEKLSEFRKTLAEWKSSAVSAGNEDLANGIFCVELMAHALSGELEMWLKLKKNDFDGAWDQLIRAQEAARWAMRAHEIGGHLEGYIRRLHAAEKLLFPHQTFMSTGFIVHSSKCSICKAEYGDCGHVMGRCYNGQFCSRVVVDAKVMEISVVEDPADKRCRVKLAGIDGAQRDIMTWLPVGSLESGVDEAVPLHSKEMAESILNRKEREN
jgi:hypothetical protein